MILDYQLKKLALEVENHWMESHDKPLMIMFLKKVSRLIHMNFSKKQIENAL